LASAKGFVEGALGRAVVGMVGHSKGGTDVLLYAAKYDDVPCVVSIAARCDVQQGVQRRLGAAVLEQLEREGQVGPCCGSGGG
jgi:hypothetical protein